MLPVSEGGSPVPPSPALGPAPAGSSTVQVAFGRLRLRLQPRLPERRWAAPHSVQPGAQVFHNYGGGDVVSDAGGFVALTAMT